MYLLRSKLLSSLSAKSYKSSGLVLRRFNSYIFKEFKDPFRPIHFRAIQAVRSLIPNNRAIMTEATSSEHFRMAMVQLLVGGDKDKNLQNAEKLIEEAAQAGAKLIALPECFNSPYGIQYFSEYAESVPDGKTCKLMSSLAKKLNVYLIAGSIPERGEDSKLYNTCTVYEPSGNLIGKHRKVHLFDIDVPGKITFKESKVLSPGKTLTIVETNLCKIGIGICYDVRFPEMAQLYREAGCELLVYPGAFNMTTGPAHWEILQKSRAVDNQVYVATISPARDATASYNAWGHSMVVNPWGKILAEAQDSQTIVYAEIDMSYLYAVREQIPVFSQRRDDMYKLSSTEPLKI